MNKNIYEMINPLHNFDVTEYSEDDDILIDNQTIDDLSEFTPEFITNYAVVKYNQLYAKYEKVLEKYIKRGLKSWYVYHLNPYIDILVIDNSTFESIGFFDRQLSYLDVNGETIINNWKQMLDYIINGKNKNAEVDFGLYISDMKDDKRTKWVYAFLKDFLIYIEDNTDYYKEKLFNPEQLDKCSFFDINTYDKQQHIFYAVDNALKIYEKYINFLDMSILNYINLDLNENSQDFIGIDYNDDDDLIIDHKTVEDVLITPKTTDELYKLIADRLKKNPENPYLLDIDTSYITDMRALFSPFIIGGELKGNHYIFRNEYKLDPYNIKNIDIHTWDTSNVTDMSFMFYECKKLESINLSGIDTSNVRSMANMFDSCETIKNINLSKLNMSNVRNFSRMFNRCLSLENIDISGCNTKNIRDVANMFNNCKNIKNIKLSKSLAGKLLTYHLQDELPLYRNEQLGIDELPYKINVV